MREQRSDDRGQAMVLLLAYVAVVVVAMVAVAQFGARVTTREQAQVAADAAALAGTIGGRPAAVRLATANGAVLVAFVAVGEEVQVVVRIDDRTAAARATRAP